MRRSNGAAPVTASRRPRFGLRAGFGVAALLWVSLALADDATGWLQQAAAAAKQLNYSGTLVYQHDGRTIVEQWVGELRNAA